MSLFVAYRVFSGFVTAYIILIKRNFWKIYHTYLFAGIPTNLYPSSVKAITEGVVLIPKAFNKSLFICISLLTFSIFNDFWIVSFHDGHARVSGSEIYTNNAIRFS